MVISRQQAILVTGVVAVLWLQPLRWNNLPFKQAIAQLLIHLNFNAPALANLPIGEIRYQPPDRGAPSRTVGGAGRLFEQRGGFEERGAVEVLQQRGGIDEGNLFDRGPRIVAPPVVAPSGGSGATRGGSPSRLENGSAPGNMRGPSIPGSEPFDPKQCAQPLPVLLVPQDHAGQTTSGAPTFFWYVSERAPRSMGFALKKVGEQRPLFEQQLQVPRAGLVRMEMPTNQPELVVGQDYIWSISVTCNVNGQAKKVLIEAGIGRVAPSTNLIQKLTAARSERDRAFIYAENGLWYNALRSLANASTDAPNNQSLFNDFLSLLNQGGLTEVASQERQRSQN